MKDFTDEEFNALDGLMTLISRHVDDQGILDFVKKYADVYHSAKINRLNRSTIEPGDALKIFTNDGEYDVIAVDVCSNGSLIS